jgi:predicted transcriptional regulator
MRDPNQLPGQLAMFGAGPEARKVSNAAREVNAPRAESTQRARILALLADLGKAGATVDAIEQTLGLPHQSASARVHDLAKAGALVDSGRRDATRTGAKAIVWIPAAGVAL